MNTWGKILILAGVWILPGFAFAAGDVEEKARRLAEDCGIREQAKGTPAEFAANQRGWMEDGSAVFLQGKADPERRARIIEIYSRIYDDIQRGLNWKEPIRKVEIPRLQAAPKLDGVPEEEEWRKGRSFSGEYPINECQPVNSGIRWWIGWHGEFLYVAAHVPDHSISVSNYRSFDKKQTPMYLKDVFEFFIRPSEDSLLYYEFLVNPDGNSWELAHVNDPFGSWIRISDDLKLNIPTRTVRTPDGYSLEMAIPLRELYGPGFHRSPEVGDEFRFMMVRSDYSGKNITYFSIFPLLYEGHNIFGYARGVLHDKN